MWHFVRPKPGMALRLPLVPYQRIRDVRQIAISRGDAFDHGGNVRREPFPQGLIRLFQPPGAGDHDLALGHLS